MNPVQALALVTQVCEQSRLTAAEHRSLQTAISVLRDKIVPKPPEKNKDEVSDHKD